MNMKKKWMGVLVVIMIIMSMFTFTGCGGAEEDVIKIGVIAPLTGEVSMYGIPVEEGTKLAAEELNANGGIDGKKVEIIAYDSKADKTEAINAYNRLRDQDGIVALLGATISGTTLSIAPIAVEDGMPILTPTATNLDITPIGDNIFRACFTDPYQGSTVAKFAAENLEAKKAAILYNIEDAYSEGLANAFKETFESYGKITNFEGYVTKDNDYKAILTKIDVEKPDVIFLPDYVAKVGTIATQVKEMGIDAVLLGGDGWDGVEADYADVVEGYYFASHYAKTDSAEIVQNFISAYETKWDKTPNSFGALAYDAANIMFETIKKAGSTDGKAIVDALEAIEFEGVTGHVTFDENGDPYKSISMIKMENGQHVLTAKVEGN